MIPALVGIGLGVLVAALVLPLLMAADPGGYNVISQWLARFDFDLEISGFLWAQLILGIPTAAYIFALLSLDGVKRPSTRLQVRMWGIPGLPDIQE